MCSVLPNFLFDNLSSKEKRRIVAVLAFLFFPMFVGERVLRDEWSEEKRGKPRESKPIR